MKFKFERHLSNFGMIYVLQSLVYIAKSHYNSWINTKLSSFRINELRRVLQRNLNNFLMVKNIKEGKIIYDETIWFPDEVSKDESYYGGVIEVILQPVAQVSLYRFKIDLRKDIEKCCTATGPRCEISGNIFDVKFTKPEEFNYER